MRVISGKLRGRKLLESNHLKALRPTTDRNRESLFNILSFGKFGFQLIGSDILDLCCGTGAIGFEALSRGAKSVRFIDSNREHLDLVTKNAEVFKVEDECEMICADAKNLLENQKSFDLIFLDPPYADDYLPIIQNLIAKNFIQKNTLLVVETRFEKEQPDFSPLELLETRKYGSTNFSFLKNV